MGESRPEELRIQNWDEHHIHPTPPSGFRLFVNLYLSKYFSIMGGKISVFVLYLHFALEQQFN